MTRGGERERERARETKRGERERKREKRKKRREEREGEEGEKREKRQRYLCKGHKKFQIFNGKPTHSD